MFTKAIAPQTIGASRVELGNDRSNRKSRSRLGTLVPLFFLLIGIVPSTQAALVGDTVVFDNISLGIWGSPTVSGDAIRFAPTDFRATAIGGPSVDFVSGAVEFDILAQPGFLISGFSFEEFGDSFLVGDSRTIVDGTLIADNVIVQLDFSETGHIFMGPGDNGFDSPEWKAVASVDFSASPVESLHIVLENELLAQAFFDVLDLADINKALAVMQVNTTVVPLPPAVLLFGSALVFMVGIGRRRSRPVA